MKFVKFVSFALITVIVVVAFSYEKIITRVLLAQYIEWAHETDMKGLKIGQPLNEQELALAAVIGIKQPKKVRVVYVDEVVTQHFFNVAEYGYDKAPLEVEASAANRVYSADW